MIPRRDAPPHEEYGLTLASLEEFTDLDGLILAVNHRAYLDDVAELFKTLKPGAVFIDVKSAIAPGRVPSSLKYWSL